eukprot:jgi/Tetstr1/452513/TSEL_039549.t1
MELVRLILLEVEDKGKNPVEWINGFAIPGYPDEAVVYHVWLLADAGFLEAKDLSTMSRILWLPKCLNWQGVEFLESIRDPEIWRQTEAGIRKVGSAGLDIVWGLAKSYAKQQVADKLGIVL